MGTDKKYDYLMNASSVVFLICYIPELYANYKNQNVNMYNMPEKVLMILGTSLAFAFSVVTEDTSLIANYGPILALDIIACATRAYYVYKNRPARVHTVEKLDSIDSTEPLKIVVVTEMTDSVKSSTENSVKTDDSMV
jgi:hypothetical protein